MMGVGISNRKITSNVFWAFGERMAAQMVSLVITVVLARLLSASEYAIVGVVSIFIGIANVFVTSGYGVALIQKVDADDLDFSTTIIFSTVLSILLYVVLFFAANPIASFYKMPQLVPVIRVMGIRLVFAAINTVQQAYISKQMAFKKFFLSTSIGTILSAIVGVSMAYMGAGVWALVAQYMTNTVVNTVVLSIVSTWRPRLQFSWYRMKGLFGYGSKLLVSDLASNMYSQMRGFLMSRFYTPVDLSYHNQAEKYTHIFINNIEVSLNKVIFQAASDAQKDRAKVKELTRKSVRMAFFILLPIQVGLAVCASDWVTLLLTDKWLPCVPYIQILCFVYLMDPIIEAHTRNIKALGYSNLLLKVMVIRYIVGIGILVLVAVCFDNPVVLAAVSIPIKLFAVVLCGVIDKKMINYSMKEQASDILAPSVVGLIMAAAIIALNSIIGHLPLILQLLLEITFGALIYLGVSSVVNRRTVQSAISMLRKLLKQNKK